MRDAGVAPDEVSYISAHGTGTTANDRIETRAVGVGQRRAFQPVERQRRRVEARPRQREHALVHGGGEDGAEAHLPAVQVVLGGTDYGELARWRDLLMERMRENPQY